METYTQQFKSMEQFYRYICDTPFNEAFRWEHHSSVEGTEGFTKTSSFGEAVELMEHGWTDMAQTLTQKLKAQASTQVMRTIQTIVSVQGFQPIVPLYLAGVPQNMVSKQMVAKKQKVVNVVKTINYNCGVSTEQIIEESIKAMQIVKKLEAMQYRVNLDVALGAEDGVRMIARIRIKSAGEKLNVSKLAFPMVHPSMLRRLMFRYIEVNPNTTKRFTLGYGQAVQYNVMQQQMEDAVVLPAIFNSNVDDIKDLAQLKATV